MRDPNSDDLRLADRANLFGGPIPLGTSLRAAAAQQMAALERARKPTPRLFQPFAGAVIELDGSPYWGPFHCCGVYVPTGAEHAHRVLIARAHLEALRENDLRD